MQIIPVIDIQGRKVVHAQGGDRANYPLLQSKLTAAVEPEQVIADLLNWYPFETFYIADLDAIERQQYRYDFYASLTQRFPQQAFWLDNGITTVAQYRQWSQCVEARHVIGSETLCDEKLIAMLAELPVILSLDFKQGRLLGNQKLLQQPALWPRTVIAMTLDKVGSGQGPDQSLLKQLQGSCEDVALFAAGGVKNSADLEQLAQNGVKGCLVASALHKGELSLQDIQACMEQEHRSP